MEEGFGKLQSDVGHIQTDIAGVKSEAHITNAKIDDVRKEVTAYVSSTRSECVQRVDDLKAYVLQSFRDSGAQLDELRLELTRNIDDVRDRIDNLQAQMLQKFDQVDLRMQLLQSELTRQIDQVKDSVHKAKIQNLLWCISLGCAFFYILAHSLKWF